MTSLRAKSYQVQVAWRESFLEAAPRSVIHWKKIYPPKKKLMDESAPKISIGFGRKNPLQKKTSSVWDILIFYRLYRMLHIVTSGFFVLRTWNEQYKGIWHGKNSLRQDVLKHILSTQDNLHPRKTNGWNRKMEVWFRLFSFSKWCFSGSSRYFSGV